MRDMRALHIITKKAICSISTINPLLDTLDNFNETNKPRNYSNNKILNKIILSKTPDDFKLVKQELSILKIVKHKYIVRLFEILETSINIFIVIFKVCIIS